MKFSLRHQSTGRVYPYLVPTGFWMVPVFFRKVHVYNRQAVPADQPVLLASNHPTAFMDPCLLCYFVDAPLYNMTRGDVFKKPFFRKLMESINMFPVYRTRDGYAGRDRNDEVFEYCRQKLADRRVVTIYVEGEHHLDRHVRPIQKGIARIAFNAGVEGLRIIPVGCTYRYGDRPRDDAMVQFGDPIFLQDYQAEYEADPAAATTRLCHDVYDALRAVCLHVQSPEDLELAEHLLDFERSDHAQPLLPAVRFDNGPFLRQKAICDALNHLPATAKNRLKMQTQDYFDRLRDARLSDEALLHPEWGRLGRLLFFALGLVPFAVGYAGRFPVVWLARTLTRKATKKREFKSSVYMGIEHLGGMVYHALLLLTALFSANPWWIALAAALPLLGWFSVFYKDKWQRWTASRRASRHAEREQLLKMRREISDYFTTESRLDKTLPSADRTIQ